MPLSDAVLSERTAPCAMRYCAAALQSACDDGCARPRSGHELPTGAISYGGGSGAEGGSDGGKLKSVPASSVGGVTGHGILQM